MSRSTARCAAMQMIFERLSGGQGGEDTLRMIYDELRAGGADIRGNEPDQEDRAYIATAFDGVLAHLEEIDAEIERTAKGWPLDRMSLVDLTILRLAIWEIDYAPKIPGNVSVAEALNLTERYSDPDDKPFVNGILGTVLRDREARKAE